MANWTIIHNPKCSKSRACLALLEGANVDFKVREYLKEPLTENELTELIEKLSAPLSAMVRSKEEEFKSSPFDLELKAEVVQNLAKTPKLLERPIVIYKDSAVIGRPPENVQEFLNSRT